MPFNAISPSKTGLVFFDVLNYGWKGLPAKEQQRADVVLRNCVLLRDAARSLQMPLFFPKADHRPDGRDVGARYTDVGHDLQPWPDPETRIRPHRKNTSGSWGAEIVEELAPSEDDYVIPKHRWSAFYQTKLELSMRARGLTGIVLCGGATEIGVASTAYAARDMDWDLVVVRDACTSPRTDVHEILMSKVFPRIGRVRSTLDALEMLRRGAALDE